MLSISTQRKIPTANETTHRGLWEKKKMKGNELKGKKIESKLFSERYNQLTRTYISNLKKSANIKYINK